MNNKIVLTILALVVINCVNGKKSLSGRGGSSSARGSSRRTSYNPHPAPTSLSYPQASAPKPSLFGWQEKSGSKQSKPQNTQTGSHSYPSSQTGLSGNKQAKSPTTNQENIQRNSATQNLNGQQTATGTHTSSQLGHSYPASNGLSGSPVNGYPQQTGSGLSGGLSGSPVNGYPQQTGSGVSHQHGSSYPQQSGVGLSGSGVPPSYTGYKSPDSNRPVSNGATYQSNNYGNNYQHPQPPPPYSNYGSNYGGHAGHASSGPQMPGYGSLSPGYFGNYANNGNRGMSRSGSALTGVGIAGAGVGTLLTGLALWNLARSTGNRHHTVIYDNRGQPVAVAPDNNNQSEANSMLADLVNCSLTISNDEKTEVLAIPCAIATSFTPDTDVKTSDTNNATDNTKCTVTVINKSGKEYMTTIPCSILLNTAAENNVTEPLTNISENSNNGTTVLTSPPTVDTNQPFALSHSSSDIDYNNTKANVDCTPKPGEILDPINPCLLVTHNLTVIPLQTTEINENHDKKD